MDKELEDLLQPGKTAHLVYGEGNINNQIRHIRAVVDDDMIVYRIWNQRKQMWQYLVSHKSEWELLYREHIIRRSK